MDISAPAQATQGRILCFHPDGRRTVFADGLFAVFGMQYLEGKLYVLHNPKFSVFTDEDGVGRDRVDLIESTNPNPWALDWNDHVPANFKLAMDGFFYVAVGDKGVYGAIGRDGRRVDLHGGGILRLRPDGTGLEVFCAGVRNILDVALDAEDEIFTYDNTDEQQWMGRLTHMVEAGFYGYPFDFIPRRPYTLWMMADYGGGAATGAFAYNEDALPPDYHGNLFLADFGKRQVMRVRVAREGGSFQAVSKEDLFTDPPEDFRPVGITLAPDGLGLYICDWQHRDTKENAVVGRLWKLRYMGESQAVKKPAWFVPAAMGKPFQATTAELIQGLSHPSRDVRLVAQRRLVERAQVVRGGRHEAPLFKSATSLNSRSSTEREIVRLLRALLKDTKSPAHARWHALWALDAIDGGKAAGQAILSAAADAEASVRRQAIRQLSTRRVQDDTSVLWDRLRDTDASVRFQAATALGRIADRRAVRPLSFRLEETNLFVRYAAFSALHRIGQRQPEAWMDIAQGLRSNNARVREGTEFALRETYDLALVRALVLIAAPWSLRKSVDAQADAPSIHEKALAPVAAREAATRLLAALHHAKPPWKGEWWAYHPANSMPPAKSVAWAGTDRVLQSLRAALDDSSAAVRRASLVGLGETKDFEAAPKLHGMFAHEADPEAKRLIIAALGALKYSAARPLVASLLIATTPSDLLGEALRIAPDLDGPEIESALVRLLTSGPSDVEILKPALDAAGSLKMVGSLDALTVYTTNASEEVRSAALRALFKTDTNAAIARVLPLLDHASVDVRRSAIAALGWAKVPSAQPALRRAFAASETRSEAIVALAQTPTTEALDAYLEGLREPSLKVREAARRALEAIRTPALPLLEGRVSQLPPEVLVPLQQIYAKNDRARALLAAAPKPLEPDDYLAYALQSAGSAERGRALFHDAGRLACSKCHVVGSSGGRIGPDLTTVGAQFSRRELAESVLFPSRAVREGYQAIQVETRDGETVTGLFKGEAAEELNLLDTEGQVHRVRKTDIVHRRFSDLSLMPEGLQTSLTLPEFAGLISFLESLRPASASQQVNGASDGFAALFNGRDLTGWQADALAVAHWQAHDGVLEHDGVAGDLWSERSFGDFILIAEWRWPDEPKWEQFPLIGLDGHEMRNADGETKTDRHLDAGGSGIILRGNGKALVNLFCHPIGSGALREYGSDVNMPAEVRRAVTPKKNADKPMGAWNRMKLTLAGDRVTVELNGEEVISRALLPGLPARGPIGFQHEHGRIQWRNVFVKELR
jgi:putative heme-binding domain-containing protein